MSITSPGRSTLQDQKRAPKPFAVKETNATRDIEGAWARNRYDAFETKLTNATVADSHARSKIHERNVPDRSLYIDDIDGARFAPIGGMERTKRKTNPLSPSYSLPSFSSPMPRIIDPSSIRDPLSIADIDGTKSKAFTSYSTRDPISVSDIPGATANFREKTKRQMLLDTFGPLSQSTMRVDFSPQELKKTSIHDLSNRHVDVMAPIYQYNGMEIADDPIKTKPKKLPKYVIGGTFSLQTSDIEGATPGRLKEKKFDRRELRNIMSTLDIVGAQADTVVHSIVSTRNTCPLSPVYKGLNFGEALEPIIKPLIDASTMGNFGPASLRYLRKKDDSLLHVASPIKRQEIRSLEREAEIDAVRGLQ